MKQLLSRFDRAYVITLASRTDRRRAVERELHRFGVSLSDSGPVRLFNAVRPEDRGGFISVGARGCFMSHLGVLELAAADRLSRVLVIEDDVTFRPNLRDVESAVVQALDATTWEWVHLGHSFPIDPGPDGLARLRDSDDVPGLHFYAVNGPHLATMIAFLRQMAARPAGHPDGGPMHVDGAFKHYRHHKPEALAYAARPSLAAQRASRSDISPGLFDRTPVLGNALEIARSAKSWWTRAPVR